MNHPQKQNTLQKNNDIMSYPPPKSILKWAGGKTQLLDKLLPKVPKNYGKYIEPFLGGGALFFAIQSTNAVIGDSNPELINLYKTIVEDLEGVIKHLKQYRNDESQYYLVRAQKWESLNSIEAAARTIYLNRTCFNGLYRVNKKGQFNVPFGRYVNPKLCDNKKLFAAAAALQKAIILNGDYKDILQENARPGDFVYLDPPYLPISQYSDFKRYTKEQFYEEDHRELAKEIYRLHALGCYVILTNSNHPLVHELYKGFQIEIVQTKRNINKKGNKRVGEDVIICISPRQRFLSRNINELLPEQVEKYPPTKFMGSKRKLLKHIWNVASQFTCDSVLDLFSGSGVVGYMFKAQKKQVFANDYLGMAASFSTALIENNDICLTDTEVARLLKPNLNADDFVSKTFKGLYYTDEENTMIDSIRANIKRMRNRYKRSIAMSALIRACLKKRPRGIFTYTGFRYDDGRKDLKMSFEEQFRSAVDVINGAVFNNGKENRSRRGDSMTVNWKPDLVYIDPPYYSLFSDNEYVRRYHFVEGLALYWKGVEIQWQTKTKKFKNYPTPFSSRLGANDAFDKLFHKFRDSLLIVSYSSNSLPTLNELVAIMARHKSKVEVVSIDHRYSFGNQGHKINNNNNGVQEYLFVGF